jgi:hypothetical protein
MRCGVRASLAFASRHCSGQVRPSLLPQRAPTTPPPHHSGASYRGQTFQADEAATPHLRHPPTPSPPSLLTHMNRFVSFVPLATMQCSCHAFQDHSRARRSRRLGGCPSAPCTDPDFGDEEGGQDEDHVGCTDGQPTNPRCSTHALHSSCSNAELAHSSRERTLVQ